MRIGDKIKLLRSEKNMSQGELADQLNLTRQTVSKWENNRALPDVENIILLSKFFDYKGIIKFSQAKHLTRQCL